MGGETSSGTVDISTPAVVFKLDPNVFHHGGLGVVRTLGRLGVPVHVVHEDRLAPAAASRYVHGRWRWTPGSDRPERIREGLARLAERIGQPAVLIPIDDAGAIFLAEHGDELRRWFLFPAPDSDLPRRTAGKHSLAELCRDGTISCPRTTVPASHEEAVAFADRVGFPLFAKLARPWDPPPGRRPRSTTLVSTRADLAAIYHAHPDALLLQEAVPGGPDWFFHGYCDAGSTCRPSFTGIKERSYPPRAGLTTLGSVVPNDRLRSEVEQFLGELHYRGPVDLDLRWDARDDRYKLLDFNPRLGAQFRLFEDAAGLDVARAAYLDLTGQPVPDGAPVPDRRFVVENYDLLAGLSHYRQGELDLRTWVRSLRGVGETAWYARDDLAPFGLMCLRFGWRVVERPLRRHARRAEPRPLRYRPGRARNRGRHRVGRGVSPNRRPGGL
jgi:predicted ATP-grasp superfamily ATP-dependent carboligase